MLEKLKTDVCEANLYLNRSGLVSLTFGNVSGIDRERALVVIKPSGVAYDVLQPEHMVVVDLNGNTVEGDLNPSSDTPTHVELYRAFKNIAGVTHAHSTQATAFAQACREIPCLGTTHADYFHGPIPVTRALTDMEVAEGYELNTGRVIVERFANLAADVMPAVLVAHHGPFTWGTSAGHSVEISIALEAVAHMALNTLTLNPAAASIPAHILEKHYSRKHGSGAYYGQK